MSTTRVITRAPLTIGELLGIFKPRIAISIALSAIGGLAISPGLLPPLPQTLLLVLAVMLAAGAAGAFNQWAEWEHDARMERTRDRPFASGRIDADTTWLVAIVALLAGSVALAAAVANWWAALYTFLGAFTYAVIYTIWLKRRTWANIVIGGLAGSFAVLAGAAAVDPALATAPVLLAVVLFLWTPPHFWSLAIAQHKDYQAGSVPMLPVVIGDAACARVILWHTVALSALSLLPAACGMGAIYLAMAVAGGGVFTLTSIALVREPTRKRAIQNFLASLMQLVLLLTGTVLDRVVLGGPV